MSYIYLFSFWAYPLGIILSDIRLHLSHRLFMPKSRPKGRPIRAVFSLSAEVSEHAVSTRSRAERTIFCETSLKAIGVIGTSLMKACSHFAIFVQIRF